MATVKAKLLSDYFRTAGGSDNHSSIREYFYYSRRSLFNPLFLLAGATIVSLFYGGTYRAGNIIGCACLAFGAYLFLRTRSLARGIQVRRAAPTRAIELDEIE